MFSRLNDTIEQSLRKAGIPADQITPACDFILYEGTVTGTTEFAMYTFTIATMKRNILAILKYSVHTVQTFVQMLIVRTLQSHGASRRGDRIRNTT